MSGYGGRTLSGLAYQSANSMNEVDAARKKAMDARIALVNAQAGMASGPRSNVAGPAMRNQKGMLRKAEPEEDGDKAEMNVKEERAQMRELSKHLPMSYSLPLEILHREKAPKPPKPSMPARKQVDQPPELTHDANVAGDYNIWYHRHQSNPEDRWNPNFRTPADTRCNPALDTGFTKADQLDDNSFMCLYWAKGSCFRGKDCNYYHRVPTLWDQQRCPVTKDIFGRERHATEREDMGGVGSFNRENRIIYVSSFGRPEGAMTWAEVEEALLSEFGAWGAVENVRIKHNSGVAFLRYKMRCSAEMAKQSMANQSLTGIRSLINVRWAREDPNPNAETDEDKAKQALMREALKNRILNMERKAAERKAFNAAEAQAATGEVVLSEADQVKEDEFERNVERMVVETQRDKAFSDVFEGFYQDHVGSGSMYDTSDSALSNQAIQHGVSQEQMQQAEQFVSDNYYPSQMSGYDDSAGPYDPTGKKSAECPKYEKVVTEEKKALDEQANEYKEIYRSDTDKDAQESGSNSAPAPQQQASFPTAAPGMENADLPPGMSNPQAAAPMDYNTLTALLTAAPPPPSHSPFMNLSQAALSRPLSQQEEPSKKKQKTVKSSFTSKPKLQLKTKKFKLAPPPGVSSAPPPGVR